MSQSSCNFLSSSWFMAFSRSLKRACPDNRASLGLSRQVKKSEMSLAVGKFGFLLSLGSCCLTSKNHRLQAMRLSCCSRVCRSVDACRNLRDQESIQSIQPLVLGPFMFLTIQTCSNYRLYGTTIHFYVLCICSVAFSKCKCNGRFNASLHPYRICSTRMLHDAALPCFASLSFFILFGSSEHPAEHTKTL